ncbi:hypothetical protein [Pedobacter sp. SYSU D00535]|uniref:hypothetical protein n=1 Tax=Pedobacter sp. SYSU D00535 TaxID=2810308 RepID=UPI001A9617A7|nr:hypothetical protein [Pedobacter sp. SYSU D00535]
MQLIPQLPLDSARIRSYLLIESFTACFKRRHQIEIRVLRLISKALMAFKTVNYLVISKQVRGMELAFFIGIDVSKNELDFAVMHGKQQLLHRETGNNSKAIKLFLKNSFSFRGSI